MNYSGEVLLDQSEPVQLCCSLDVLRTRPPDPPGDQVLDKADEAELLSGEGDGSGASGGGCLLLEADHRGCTQRTEVDLGTAGQDGSGTQHIQAHTEINNTPDNRSADGLIQRTILIRTELLSRDNVAALGRSVLWLLAPNYSFLCNQVTERGLAAYVDARQTRLPHDLKNESSTAAWGVQEPSWRMSLCPSERQDGRR